MQPIVTRKEALEKGLLRYFTGEPCKHGHIAERYRNRVCIECAFIHSENQRKKPRTSYEHLRDKDTFYKRTYGISLDDFLKRAVEQGNQCAICLRRTKLVADHCHIKGEFRGLICRKCNSGLGFFDDSPAIVTNALNYLLGKDL